MSIINDYKNAGSALECYLRGKSFNQHLAEIKDEKLRQSVLEEIEEHKKGQNGNLEAHAEIYKAKAELEDVRKIVRYLINELNLDEEEPECPCCKHRTNDKKNT